MLPHTDQQSMWMPHTDPCGSLKQITLRNKGVGDGGREGIKQTTLPSICKQNKYISFEYHYAKA